MSGRVEYCYAEQLLWTAIKPRLALIAADYKRQFGQATATMVEDMAETFFSEASRILCEHGHRRVFGDDHLFNKCLRWALYWCKRIAAQTRRRRHSRFANTYMKGLANSIKRRVSDADKRAMLAQQWHKAGETLREIAQRLGCTVRTVRNLLKRVVAVKSGKKILVQDRPKKTVQNPLPDFPDAALDALGNQIPALLRALWEANPLKSHQTRPNAP